MNKYVIELRPDCKVVQQICESDGQVSIGAKNINYLEELNSDYINEHFGDLQDTAYKKGLHDGESKCGYCNEYQKGFEDGKAQREHDDKIEVGDEVKPFYTDINGVVTLIDGDTICVLWRDGSSTSMIKLKDLCKTGRHFDIASILEEMRHD